MSTQTYRELTTDQRRLLDELDGDDSGTDMRVLLRAADAPDFDKAAVAEALAGEEAALEFRR